MAAVKFQLNTPVEITRDLQVQMVHQVSGKSIAATPFLDGTVNVRNLDPGEYRVQVRHPNLPFQVLDRPVKVLTERPTFVPLQIDLDIFTNTPVRDIAEADLEPVRGQLGDAADTADVQAAKQGGQPIYADDWNTLAGTVASVATATVDLTRRVSPHGHDHPELIEKMDEIQRNLQRFLEVFGQSMAQVQRQLERLAMEVRTQQALDRLPDVTPTQRAEVEGIVARLDAVRIENPYLYTRELRRTGEQLTAKMAELLPADQPDLATEPAIVELTTAARTMAETIPAASYEEEVRNHLRVDSRSTGGNLSAVITQGIAGANP